MAHSIDAEQDGDKYESERYPVKAVKVRGEKYRWYNEKLDTMCKGIKVAKRAKEKKDG